MSRTIRQRDATPEEIAEWEAVPSLDGSTPDIRLDELIPVVFEELEDGEVIRSWVSWVDRTS